MKKSEFVIISKFSLSTSASKIYFIWEKGELSVRIKILFGMCELFG